MSEQDRQEQPLRSLELMASTQPPGHAKAGAHLGWVGKPKAEYLRVSGSLTVLVNKVGQAHMALGAAVAVAHINKTTHTRVALQVATEAMAAVEDTAAMEDIQGVHP